MCEMRALDQMTLKFTLAIIFCNITNMRKFQEGGLGPILTVTYLLPLIPG